MNDTVEETRSGAAEMSFFGHLEELRSRLFKTVAGILVACIGTGYFREEIMNKLLLGPAVRHGISLQNLEPFGQAFLYFKVIFFTGLIASSPWILFQIWSFVAPGLYLHERRWARTITVLTSLCFLMGVSFAYFLLIPSMMSYIKAVANPNIQDNISTSSYFSFFVNMLLASGLIFELPMVTWVLARIGMVSPALMSKYRRHSIIVILIIAAIVTPTPDPITQLMVAVPLYILYEISVVIARFAYKRRDEEPATP